MAAYPCFTFTDFVWDLETRVDNGNFVIGCIVALVVINVAAIIFITISSIIQRVRFYFLRKSQLKALEKRKQAYNLKIQQDLDYADQRSQAILDLFRRPEHLEEEKRRDIHEKIEVKAKSFKESAEAADEKIINPSAPLQAPQKSTLIETKLQTSKKALVSEKQELSKLVISFDDYSSVDDPRKFIDALELELDKMSRPKNILINPDGVMNLDQEDDFKGPTSKVDQLLLEDKIEEAQQAVNENIERLDAVGELIT